MKHLFLRLLWASLLSVAFFVALTRGTSADGNARLQTWQEHVRLRDSSPFRGMHWQPLGPSLQGARIEALAVSAPGSSTIYAGPGAGNVWKSVNNGMTWQPIFDHESAFAIGDIAVAPSNPEIVDVPTGTIFCKAALFEQGIVVANRPSHPKRLIVLATCGACIRSMTSLRTIPCGSFEPKTRKSLAAVSITRTSSKTSLSVATT